MLSGYFTQADGPSELLSEDGGVAVDVVVPNTERALLNQVAARGVITSQEPHPKGTHLVGMVPAALRQELLQRCVSGDDEEEDNDDSGIKPPMLATHSRTPLVVHGAAGSGKSGAIANWFLRNIRAGFVLVHFIGSSSNTTDHLALVRRILEELKKAFRLEGEVPADPKTLCELLPLWIERACKVSPIAILIDGLEQLDDDGVGDSSTAGTFYLASRRL